MASSYALATVKTENYLETQKEARQHRDNFRNNADPILQRNPNFEKHSRCNNETKNYFAQLEATNDFKPHKKVIPQKFNTFLTESNIIADDVNCRKTCKRQLAHEYEARIHNEKPHMIRMIKCKAGDTQIKSIFDSEIPIPKERVHVKLLRNGGEPSEQTKRLAERQNYLPHSIDGRSSKKTKSFDHLNGGQIINPCQEESIRRKNIIQQKSSINDLLNQDNMPCLGHECTGKPTSVGIHILKKSLDMNKKMFVK